MNKLNALILSSAAIGVLAGCSANASSDEQPGEVAAEIKISQPKPRSRSDLSLASYKEKIFSILENSHTGLQKYSVR